MTSDPRFSALCDLLCRRSQAHANARLRSLVGQAAYLSEYGVLQHVVAEPNRQVFISSMAHARKVAQQTAFSPLLGFWQEVTPKLRTASFDGILFDAFPDAAVRQLVSTPLLDDPPCLLSALTCRLAIPALCARVPLCNPCSLRGARFSRRSLCSLRSRAARADPEVVGSASPSAQDVAFFREARRLLRPGGVLTFFHRYSLPSISLASPPAPPSPLITLAHLLPQLMRRARLRTRRRQGVRVVAEDGRGPAERGLARERDPSRGAPGAGARY